VGRPLRETFHDLRDVRLFLRTAVRLISARRALGRAPIPTMLERFTPPLGATPSAAAPERLATYVDWWLRAWWFPVRYNCWLRGLVLFELTRLEGIKGVTLHVAVRVDAPDLAGHAWLVRDGTPFLEPPGRPGLDELLLLIRHPREEDES
jgi:hypothetical protein